MSDAPILSLRLQDFQEASNVTTKNGIANRLKESLDSGFVFVETGISELFLDEVYTNLEKFFKFDTGTKNLYQAPGSKGSRGYTPIGIEKAEGQDVADFKEMINWGRHLVNGHWLRERYGSHYSENVFPEEEINGISKLLTEFYTKIEDVQREVLKILAWHYGLGEEYFPRMIHNGTTLARAIHYPAMSEQPADGEEHIWAARHRDINLITVLPRATEKGLQLEVEGEWHDVEPPAGHAVLNTGMMLERVTNGDLGSNGYHRVIADPEMNVDRLSIVQFCHPAPHVMLAPIDNGQPVQFPTISAGDALEEVLEAIGLGAASKMTS